MLRQISNNMISKTSRLHHRIFLPIRVRQTVVRIFRIFTSRTSRISCTSHTSRISRTSCTSCTSYTSRTSCFWHLGTKIMNLAAHSPLPLASWVHIFVNLLVSMCLKVPAFQEIFRIIVAEILFTSVCVLYISLEVCQEGKYFSTKRAGKGFFSLSAFL